MKKNNKKIYLDYKKINLDTLKSQNLINIHFIGVGGVSMSSLAIYAQMNGFCVSGSDINNNTYIENLKEKGIKIFNNHNEQNVIGKDIIVYSNATENCNEFLEAKQEQKIIFSRAEFLAIILKDYKTKICVSGAHGKTTTSALIYSILKQANKQPSLHLGGNLIDIQQNYDYAKKDYIVCESCEYKDSFLTLSPTYGVILNICAEHLDYFKNYNNVYNSFKKFAENSSNLIVFNEFKNISNKSISYGYKNANFTAKNIKTTKLGTTTFTCLKNNKHYCKVNLNLVGTHNVLNALASITVADCLNIKKTDIQAALKNFCGVERRFQFLRKEPLIIDDYAHHPDEIKAILKILKQNFKQKFLVVFQPHTYSRTKTLMSEFIDCFKCCKDLVIYKTYSARERYNKKGSGLNLSKNIGKNSSYIKNKKELVKIVLKKIKQNFGIIFLGAGDIYDIAKIVNKCVDKCYNIW